MKLYIGGAYQGQDELAREENPGAELFLNFHETLRQVIEAGGNPVDYVRAFLAEHPQAVVTANEIGSGIVPMSAADRAWREGAGRGMCILAQAAERVVRVVCGIGSVIK